MSEPTYQDGPTTSEIDHGTAADWRDDQFELSGCTALDVGHGFDSFTVTLVGGLDAPREQATYKLTSAGRDPGRRVPRSGRRATPTGIELEAVFNQRKR